MSRKLWAATILTELLGIMVVCVGIGIEIAMRAALGFALITVGSLFIAAGGAVYAKFLRRP